MKIPSDKLPCLAVDTSQKIMTVAMFTDGKSMASRVEGEKNHSARLLPAIDALLKAMSLTAADMKCFALVTGTGSFTGLRVGLATLKGLAFGRHTPVAPVNSEELLAYYEASADRAEETFLKTISEKLANGNLISLAEAELVYENPETKRFKY